MLFVNSNLLEFDLANENISLMIQLKQHQRIASNGFLTEKHCLLYLNFHA